jgi:hypothetical protein
MRALFEALLGTTLADVPEYYGGEFFAATGPEIVRLNAESAPLWDECMLRAAAGTAKLNEEAHYLSFLYFKLGFRGGTANEFIRRIWTQRRLMDSTPSDLKLPIWHVPAEKGFGYRDLYRYVADPESWFWKDSTDCFWKTRLASLMGIPRPKFGKKVKDAFRAIVRRLI